MDETHTFTVIPELMVKSIERGNGRQMTNSTHGKMSCQDEGQTTRRLGNNMEDIIQHNSQKEPVLVTP